MVSTVNPHSLADRFIQVALFGLILILPTSPVLATNWTGATSEDWFDAGNWSGGVPLTTTDSFIDTTVNAPEITTEGAAGRLICVGNNGTGALTISGGGLLTSSNQSRIGNNFGSVGTALVTGSGSVWESASEFRVGSDGTGTLIVSNDGAVASVGRTHIGVTGNGSITVSNGGSVESGGTNMASQEGSSATVLLTGLGSNWSTSTISGLKVAIRGAASMLISGGATGSGRFITIGEQLTGNGTLEMTGVGTRWETSGAVNVGYLGTGQLLISNGAKIHASVSNPMTDYSEIGFGASSSGVVLITGDGSEWRNERDLYFGRAGQGTLTVSDKGLISSGTVIHMAHEMGSTGTLNIGSAAGDAAVAAGFVETPVVSFGDGTGTILLNHTEGCGASGMGCAAGGVAGPSGSARGYEFAPDVTGAGTIAAVSGVTYFTGDMSGFTGNATVSQAARLFLSAAYGGSMSVSDGGVVTANNTVSGSVNVNDGGTLKGSGTIGGDATIGLGGILAPGNSIGTIQVVGDVNFAPGSFYDVEVNASGQSDRTEATGAANLTGGTVRLSGEPESGGVYGLGSYWILSAAGGVNGTFDAVTFTTAPLFLDAALSYEANDIYANLTRNGTSFVSVAATPNQQQVATALDTMTGDNLALSAIAGQVSAQGARAAYRALTGELHAGIKGSLLGASGLEQVIGARQDTQLTTQRNLWALAYGDWSERKGDNTNTFAFDHHEKGIAFGYDTPVKEYSGTNLGVAFSYGRSSYDLATEANNSASGTADHYRLAVYASRQMGPISLRGAGQYGLHQIDTDRTVAFAGYSARHRADYHAHSLGGIAEVGYKLAPVPAAQIEPFARLSYGMAALNAIKERGGDGALRGESDLASQGSTMVGMRAEQSFRTFDRLTACGETIANHPCGLLKAELGWQRLLGEAHPSGRYNFSGSSAFVTQGAAAARDALEVKVGFDVSVTERATIGLSYAGSFAAETSANAIRGGLNWRW